MPKPFSMIREFKLADWFTLGNAMSGTGALFCMMSFIAEGDIVQVYFACGLVLSALVFDVLDGRIARWRRCSSELGRELDSLADVISFGVTPAIIAYGLGMSSLWDRVLLGYFIACGVSRLARYNITTESLSNDAGKVTHFEGTPIPTSFALVIMLGIAAANGAWGPNLWGGSVDILGYALHPLTLSFGLSGSLMISRIRIPKP
ncbi:CDP-alcohol phosphatidyltransferase family protein [Castellaniella sp.]|uniref:CDP-alcohol phosphatidyltransferase family protein n=1 Tax=Castellaniella sp. TaxID=1955812 RepID=UPI002AFF8FC8|nr:CDP-alcohol phosphatidyltransferase family protein [Castellaniella sp.]